MDITSPLDLGGHGMTDEAKLRTITGLSCAWDGEPIKRVRAKETVILYGRRVGMHLMVQPEVAATALGDELLAAHPSNEGNCHHGKN